MASRIESNQQFLTDLFAGPFRGHAVIFDPVFPFPITWEQGDVTVAENPVADWVPQLLRMYEYRLQWSEAIQDDSVPYANVWSGTALFAAAFGSPVHCYEDSPPCALPCVSTAEEADALAMPTLQARPLARALECAQLLREALGPDVPIAVPDIQSPFDIAALIWRKEDLFVAMYEEPEAVKRLVDKCHRLLVDFLQTFRREIGNVNYCHCPYAWAPPELGIWLSEDEAGSLTPAMFEEFCLPSLIDLSQTFGGLFMHCCANADHQYANLLKIPNFRGFNRHQDATDAQLTVDTFAGRTPWMVAWIYRDFADRLLDMAPANMRFLLNMAAAYGEDEAKALYAHLRERSPRVEAASV